MTGANVSVVKLLRELYFNRIGLLFLSTILASVAMLTVAAGTTGRMSGFWLAFGTSLLATCTFSFFYLLFTTSRFNDFLRTSVAVSIEERVTSVKHDLLDTIRSDHEEFLPISTYEGTNVPTYNFNKDLNLCLNASERYTFLGVTARYSIARLAASSYRFEQVRILIADPIKPESVIYRARHDIDTDPQDDDTQLDRIRRRMIDHIWMSIVGAYQIRRKCEQIEFCLVSDPPTDRVEMLDDDAFVTPFGDEQARKYRFPRTLRFGRNSLEYRTYLKYAGQLFSSPYPIRFQIPRDDDVTSLFDTLNSARLDFQPASYEGLVREFNEFKNELPPEILA